MKWITRMLGKAKKKRHGFTLIELMVVLIIIAILAIAAVPTYMYFVHRAYESEAAASLGAIKTAEIVYKAENNVFTKTWVSPTGIGMTSGDFAQNRWFTAECFYLDQTGSTDFTAYCDGSLSAISDKVKVEKICKTLSNDGDIGNHPPGTIPASAVPVVP